MERRIVEKKRRNHIKTLYSKLYSLLPSSTSASKEVLPPLTDQLDEARIYIESLHRKLEMNKEKKEKLLLGKRPYSSSSSTETPKSRKLTNVEIHDMGSNMDTIFITGLEEQASFYGIIRLLREEGFEVVTANFSSNGNSMLQISYERGGKSTTAMADSAAVSKRLKELIYGYSHGEVESRLDLWDYDIEPDVLSYELLPPIMPTGNITRQETRQAMDDLKLEKWICIWHRQITALQSILYDSIDLQVSAEEKLWTWYQKLQKFQEGYIMDVALTNG